MVMTRRFPAFTVTAKAEKALKDGHPWVYDTEIKSVIPPSSELPENGKLMDVFSHKGAYLGTGFYSAKSKIRIRLLSSNANEIFDEAFFERRLRYAVAYRKTVMRPDGFCCCRLVFGEADGLPGLTIDRFGDILVAQVLSYGMDKIKGMIFGLLRKLMSDEYGEKISGIYERNDLPIRELEGLSQYKGWAGEETCPEGSHPEGTQSEREPPERTHPQKTKTEIVENGIRYTVDFENGQKTGFFLDQKYNRLAVAHIAAGMRVLDCFTHTGSFALNAAAAGAAAVTAVDISQPAVDMAKENAVLNGFADRISFIKADVFNYLINLTESKQNLYDLIILDPPAFAKNRTEAANAQRGYKEINFRAMKALSRGGYLATCSCSHFISDELFTQTLKSAAHDASLQLKQVEARQQSPDHPILWNVPETSYLKFRIFQVV